MKSLQWITVLTVVSILSAASVASAQTPTIRAYFDENMTMMSKDCPPGGGQDTLYLVAEGFSAYVTGVQYMVAYPASMTWLADLDMPPVTIGNTRDGISEGFPIPLNGIAGAVVGKALIQWNCNDCSSADDPVVIQDHPLTGPVKGVLWPNYVDELAVGMTSLVCPTVPTEETTWGQVKALYQQ